MQSMFNDINQAREVLQGKIVNTPTLKLNEDDIQEMLPHDADVSIKLELFQQNQEVLTQLEGPLSHIFKLMLQ